MIPLPCIKTKLALRSVATACSGGYFHSERAIMYLLHYTFRKFAKQTNKERPQKDQHMSQHRKQ